MEDWQAQLDRGDTAAAWDRFVTRYRRVIFAAIRHYVQDYDDVMDVFARVCEVLREDDLRRLREFHAQPEHRARVSTWLVTVVRHIAVDWFRRRDGRRRTPAIVGRLPPRQRRIFELVFLDGRGHLEAYEVLHSREAPDLAFKEFLADLRATYRAVSEGQRGALIRDLLPEPPSGSATDSSNPVEAAERRAILERALGSLSPEDRLAVELYVVEELPAADVARITGLSNAKAVYNRVYRALAGLRAYLVAQGISRGDV